MREFVDQQDFRTALQRRVEVELPAHHAAIADRQRRQAFERLEQALGLVAAVRLDVADHDVGARRLRGERGLEHRVGLADARGGAEEDAQAAAARACLLGLHLRQQLVRIRAFVGHRAIIGPASRARFSSSTFTRGSPSTPNVRPSVASRTSCRVTVLGQAARPRHARHLEFARPRAKCAGRDRCPRP